MSDQLPNFQTLLQNTINASTEALLEHGLGVGSLFNPDITTGTHPRSATWTFKPDQPPESTAKPDPTYATYEQKTMYVRVEPSEPGVIDLDSSEYSWEQPKPPIPLPGPSGE